MGDVSDGRGRDVSPSVISIKFSSLSQHKSVCLLYNVTSLQVSCLPFQALKPLLYPYMGILKLPLEKGSGKKNLHAIFSNL